MALGAVVSAREPSCPHWLPVHARARPHPTCLRASLPAFRPAIETGNSNGRIERDIALYTLLRLPKRAAVC